MPYRICKTFEIENGHMLSKHPDKCRFPHGHTRKVEFILECADLDENEMVCDFKVIREAAESILDAYDHAMCLNTADPDFERFKASYGDRVIGFLKQDPTTEVIAKTIHDHFKNALAEYSKRPTNRYPLRDRARIVRVRVWETSSSWAEYSE